MPVTIDGEVIEGAHIGHLLGFPTANIELPESAHVADGVYAARIGLDGCYHIAVANVGRAPSIKKAQRSIVEVHLLEFQGDLYGRHITVELCCRLRDERLFDSIAALEHQIEEDCAATRRYFAAASCAEDRS